MIRKTLLAAGILAMAGCAQDTSNKGVGFGTSIGQPQLAAVQRQPSAPAPAGAAISGARLDVPTYTIQSRSYRKRGKSKGLRTAAGQTRAVGMGMFSAPEEKIVEIEDYRLGLKHVRYDAHDFIVVSFRGGGGLFGAYSRPWQNQTRAHAEAATNCSIVDGWYASGAHMAPAKIYALSC